MSDELKQAAQKALEAMRELLDDDGENRAVRTFLMHYGAPGMTVKRMRDNMRLAGFDGCWPEWANDQDGHLTKFGTQQWLRYLFALEPAAPLQQKEEAKPPRFPTMLRKMWSGGEVQAWIDEHWSAPLQQPSQLATDILAAAAYLDCREGDASMPVREAERIATALRAMVSAPQGDQK